MIGFIILLIFICVAEAIVATYVIVNQRETVLTCREVIKTMERAEREREALAPVCTCEHAYSFHGPKGCGQTVKYEVRGQVLGTWSNFDKRVTCRCVKYIGPEPLPTYYHPLEIGN